VTSVDAAGRAAQDAADGAWRNGSAALVAGLARIVGDIGTAEEIAQDVLVLAAERWPAEGVPDDPAGWLVDAGRQRATDLVRRRTTRPAGPDPAPATAAEARDDLLALVYAVCHPVLATEERVALALSILAGLRTDQIARALLVSEATVARRVVAAKRALSGIPFAPPPPGEIAGRLPGVLEIVYLVFNEGYSATTPPDRARPALCRDAIRIGRMLAGLLPDESEVHGLVALMELQASRIPARTSADGSRVLLPDQDRGRWDSRLVGHGLAALDRVAELSGVYRPYALRASIAACHARARSTTDTDWRRIAALYGVLASVSPSPVVELNRAVAVAFAEGPASGLVIVDRLVAAGTLSSHAHLPAVRGDLLARCGRRDEARREFERAAALTRNDRERDTFQRRVRDLA